MVRVTGLSVDDGDVTAAFVFNAVDARFERDRNGCDRARTWCDWCNDDAVDASVFLFYFSSIPIRKNSIKLSDLKTKKNISCWLVLMRLLVQMQAESDCFFLQFFSISICTLSQKCGSSQHESCLNEFDILTLRQNKFHLSNFSMRPEGN